MALCPRCKEDMPLLSKICTVCGHVEQGDSEEMTVNEFAKVLDKNLHDIQQIPKPSFGKSMAQLTFIIFPLLALLTLVIAIVSEAGIVWIFFGLFLALSINAIIKKRRGKLGNDPFNREFTKQKAKYDYDERVAKRSFGKSSEVTALLNEISTEIAIIERGRKSSNRRNSIVWLVIVALFVGCVVAFMVMSKNQPPKEFNYQEMVELYVSSPNGTPSDVNTGRLEAINSALSSGDSGAAERFFDEHCAGNIGDLECATLIVNHYNKKGDELSKEAAAKFVENCTTMRYSSDKATLKKLLTQ